MFLFYKYLLISFLTLIVLISIVGTLNGRSIDKVDGISEFLLDRSNDNFIYIFEQKIIQNEMVRIVFPSTYDLVKNTNLKVLLSNSKVWASCVENDLENYGVSIIDKVISENKVFPNINQWIDNYIKLIQHSTIQIDSIDYPLNRVPFPKPDLSILATINPIHDAILSISANIDSISRSLNDLTVQQLFGHFDLLSGLIKKTKSSIVDFTILVEDLENPISNNTELSNFFNQYSDHILKVELIINIISSVSDSTNSFTYRVSNSFILMDYFIDSLNKQIKPQDLQKFKDIAIFFAQLSDATSPLEAQTILKNATIPSVSFGLKRQPREHHFLVTSYLGISLIENTEKTYNFEFTLSAPIGIEYNWGTKSSHSISLFYSFIDFGKAINDHIQDQKSTLEIGDLIDNSVYVSFGVKDIPLAIQISYTRNDQKYFGLGVRFDMPLLVLY
ncbi:MAG: hypothetical protein HQ510_09090 [Candidatus Marinimicrobia bacterium]|nr:hypothetical protein [Candidatus Neomarinimicrobiota bacterium]